MSLNKCNVMVNFEPGECTREMFFSVSDTGNLEKKTEYPQDLSLQRCDY